MGAAVASVNRGMLVHWAAEGLAPVVSGCAAALAAGPRKGEGAGKPDRPSWRAINYFGPPIVERWRAGLKDQPREAQLEAIGALAGLSADDGRREAAEAVERFAAAASPEDKGIAVEYLSAIPLAVRRSLVADPINGLSTLPNNLGSDAEQTLIRLLPTDVPPLPLGSDLPGTSYRLEELLGMGGFGAVYKARNRFEQNQPPRAIKFCLDPSMVATLHRERAILDRLMAVDGATWSNRIVRLYGYALDVQPPFLVYEFVSGGDLTSHLMTTLQQTGRGFSPARALELIRQVVEALAFAHGQGLVHRDLKPANVLVSGNTVKLTDFGIGGVVATHALRNTAMGSAAFSHLTAADQARLFRGSGTPLYMSAEQRRGDQPDPRHDLYSLGVMWYQLLVGDVTRELHPGWPDELTEEFGTPKEHIQMIQRCVGYFKKRPANARDLLALLRLANAAQAPAAAPNRPVALAGSGPAEPARAAAEYEHLQMLLADQIDRDALADARETAAAILRLQPANQEARAALEFIDKRLTVPMGEVHRFTRHQGWVRGVAFGPDGRHALSGGDDGSVRLWDLDGGRELRCLSGHTAAVMSVAFAADGRLAVSGSWDGTARLWDVAAGRELRRLEGGWKALKCVAFSPDGRLVLTGSDDNLVHLWDVNSGEEVYVFDGHTDLVQSVAFTPDGRLAVSGSDDGTVRVWDLAGGGEHQCLRGHQDSVTNVACAPNNCLVLSASSDTTVRLWDLAGGREVRRFTGHTNWVNSVAFSADGRHALTGSGGEIKDGRFLDGDDTTVRLWDLTGGHELCRFEGHQASVTSVALGPGGRLALSGSLDKTVRLLSLPGQVMTG